MKRKKLKLFILLTIILVISIGFAVVSTSLTINGLFTFPSNTWNVYLDNVVVDQNGTTTNVPTINSDKDTLTFTSTLNKPGDYYSFNVDVVNNSTIDAMLGSITIDGITSTYSDYLACVVTYSNGTTPNTNDILYKTARVTLNVKLYYKEITREQIPSTDLTPTINITINYRQANNNAVLVADTNHWNFDYTGTSQTFTPIKNGTYKVELWGASGNYTVELFSESKKNGKGAYSQGKIFLSETEHLYLYIGEEGGNPAEKKFGNSQLEYRYNGGGLGETDGGGSSDIRMVNGNWNSFDSLKSRLMVAAGGGAGFFKKDESGSAGDGGGLIGYNALLTNFISYSGFGGTQISGGNTGETYYNSMNYKSDWKSTGTGIFGKGGYVLAYERDNMYESVGGQYKSSGGGSGYFGGGHGTHTGSDWSGGGGGSSYISGHAGCVAIDESSTEDNIVFKTDSNGKDCSTIESSTFNSLGYNTDPKCSIHYSDKVFTDTVMIDGEGYSWTTVKGNTVVGMPNKNGIGTVTGNTGNGFAKITLIN